MVEIYPVVGVVDLFLDDCQCLRIALFCHQVIDSGSLNGVEGVVDIRILFGQLLDGIVGLLDFLVGQ